LIRSAPIAYVQNDDGIGVQLVTTFGVTVVFVNTGAAQPPVNVPTTVAPD
jgi:hypothetical protein